MSLENNLNNQEDKQILKTIGSKEEVYNGLAKKTSGGLKQEDLIINNKGKIVSKKRSEHGKKMAAANLIRKQQSSESKSEEEPNEEVEIKEEIKEGKIPDPIANPINAAINEEKAAEIDPNLTSFHLAQNALNDPKNTPLKQRVRKISNLNSNSNKK